MTAVAPAQTNASITGAWSPGKNLAALFARQQDAFDLINGLRSMSFLWILIFHTCYSYGMVAGKESVFALGEASPLLWWIFNADKAVDLFFILSGFLISLILFKEVNRTGTIRLGRFYFRRYLRLTPVYALILFLYWLSGGRNHEYVWANLFYINNFLELDQMALQWTWTLAVEEQFYLLLPLLLIVVARLPGQPFLRVLGGLLLLSFVARLAAFYFLPDMWSSDYRALLTDKEICPTFYTNIYDNLITRYGPFVCGTFAACAYCFHREQLTTWLLAHRRAFFAINLLMATLTLFFLFFPVTNEVLDGGSWGLRTYLVVNRTLFSAGIAWFMLTVFLQLHDGHWLARILSIRLWQPFSQLTYSMYLVHMIVIIGVMFQINYLFTHQWAIADASWRIFATLTVTATLSLLITMLIGVLCWLLVEKPFLNLRDRAATSRGATTSAPIQHSLG